jgi:hypothetical protein
MIIDLEIAKRQLGRIDDSDDDRIMRELDSAIVIVLDYLKVDSDTYEDSNGDNDFPTLVGASVLLVLQSLYEFPEKDPLTDAVVSILRRARDPALA